MVKEEVLTQARRHVVEGETLVANQKTVVATLRAKGARGRIVVEAREVLHILEESLHHHRTLIRSLRND